MRRRMAFIAVASVLFLALFSPCFAAGPINPSLQISQFVTTASSPSKMRIESVPSGSGLDLCCVWLESTSYINSARRYYFSSTLSLSGISNLPPNNTYQDIDVIDATTDCNIVALESMNFYVSGETGSSVPVANAVSIGVSSTSSYGWVKAVRDNTGAISQFTLGYTFVGGVETRRLSDTTVLVATARSDTIGLFIGSITNSVGTKIASIPLTSIPRSISIAVYSSTTWVVCAITDSFICVFSTAPTVYQIISSPTFVGTPTMTAIAFVDCNNVAFVLANANQYVLQLLDLTTGPSANTGGYLASVSGLSAIHMATTQKTTSILLANSTAVYLEVFTWGFPSACGAGEPLSVPVMGVTPSSTPFAPPIPSPTTPSSTPSQQTPQSSSGTPNSVPEITPSSTTSPESSPNSPSDNGTTTNPGIKEPSSNVADVPKGDSPPGVNAVGLGVGLAVPLAVLGVGAFLLVFLLRRRNKKRKENKSLTQTNPVNDVDSPPPSAQPTDPGVYQNLPSNNATNKNTYTSLGSVASNDSFTTASAAIELPEIDKRLHIPYKSLVFIKEIGAGSYGKVFLGEWRGAKVAIKVNNQITDVDGFLAEAKLTLGIAPHPNLVQTFGVSLDGPNPCIVLEYCGGGSLDLLLYDEKNKLDAAKQREFAMKIAYGLLHLHNNNIVHRDLAARNILLTVDQQPKISDFGMSRVIQEENSKGHTKTNFGPIRWMAPESLRDRSYSVKSDVWSYGIVVNEILSRKEPHVNEDQLSIAVKIRDQAVTPEIPSDADPALVEVIHKCLKADAKDRPTMEELCQFLRAKID